jgi:hypothetical protein
VVYEYIDHGHRNGAARTENFGSTYSTRNDAEANMSITEKLVFRNLQEAEQLMENSTDPVVRAILKQIYSAITWETVEHKRLPEGEFDVGYCFKVLAGVLTRATLELILQNPDSPFPRDDGF